MAPNDFPVVHYPERNQLEPYVTAVVTAVVLLFLLLPLTIQLLQIKVIASKRASLQRHQLEKLRSHRLEEKQPPADKSTMYLCSSSACFDTGREISDLIKYERAPCKKADAFLCQTSSRPFQETQRLLLWQEMLRTLHDFSRSTDPFLKKIYSHFHVCRSHGSSQSSEWPALPEVVQKRIPQPLGLAEWPVVSNAALPRVSFSAAKLAQIYGSFPLVRIALQVKEGKRYIQVTEPDTIRDMFQMDKYRYKEEALLFFLQKLAQGPPDSEDAKNPSRYTAVLRGALDVEAKLTQMKHADEEICAAPDLAVRSIKDIADSEVWDWEEFLRIVLKDIHEEPVTPITIVLFKKRFVDDLMELLRKTNMTDVMTFLVMRAALSLLPAAVGEIRDEPFVQDALALRYGGRVEHFCAESTFSLFRFHFLGLLAQRISNGTAQKTINDITDVYIPSMLELFHNSIDSPQAYETIQKKMSELRINIGPIESTCSGSTECASLYKYVPVMREAEKYGLITIALTMVTHIELKLTKDQPGWRDVTFGTTGILAFGTNILYLPVHLVNSEFVGDESFMHIGTFGKAIIESLLPAFLHEGLTFYRRGGFSSHMDEATNVRWNLLAECIARGFRGFKRTPNATNAWPNRRPMMQVLRLGAAYKAYHKLIDRLKGRTKTSDKLLRLSDSVFIEPDQLFFVMYGWSLCNGDGTPERSIARDHPTRWSIQQLLENNRAFQSAFRCPMVGNSTACLASFL